MASDALTARGRLLAVAEGLADVIPTATGACEEAAAVLLRLHLEVTMLRGLLRPDVASSALLAQAVERGALEVEAARRRKERPAFPIRPIFVGANSERQSVGDPGHCERCATVGHVAAHPDLGCADVGCHLGHGPEDGA